MNAPLGSLAKRLRLLWCIDERQPHPNQLVPGTQYLDRVAIGYPDAPALDGLTLINRRTCVAVCA
jgi:hypothetical protein